MLKIRTISDTPEELQVALVGHLTVEYLPCIQTMLEQARDRKSNLVLDLRELSLVDREAVQALKRWKEQGVVSIHCPAYVDRWVRQEQQS